MNRIEKIFNLLAGGAKQGHEGDRFLVGLTALIVILGLIMLFSASPAVAYVKFNDSYYFIKHQALMFGIGIFAFLFFARIDYRIWKEHASTLLFISILLLLLVFIPGLRAEWGTARSWINVFGFSIQPSEFVKLSFLLYLSAWLEKRTSKLGNLSEGFGPFVTILGIIIALMILQPDIGTLAIIAAVSLVVYYIAGGKKRHIAIITLIGIAGLAIMLGIKPYQKDRFRCMADPNFDTQKTCYQVNQALIAVGSGGIWGRGIGESRQKFLYLPEVVGDSIFAVIAEEMGFVFSLVLIGLFCAYLYRSYRISEAAPDLFGKLAAFGIATWISLQAMINIGGTINIMPMTGVPLPFISYGGSAIIASLAATGLLFNISKNIKRKRA